MVYAQQVRIQHFSLSEGPWETVEDPRLWYSVELGSEWRGLERLT